MPLENKSRRAILWTLVALVVVVLVLIIASILSQGKPTPVNQETPGGDQLIPPASDLNQAPPTPPSDATNAAPTTTQQSISDTEAALGAVAELNADLESADLKNLDADLDAFEKQLKNL